MRSKTERTICGTCEYWTGERFPVFDKNGNPKVDIVDDFGICENENCSKFVGVKRKKDAKCRHFSKWTEIL